MYRAFVLSAALSACSPYSPDLGGTPYLCSSVEPQCPDGYTCQAIGTQNVCVDMNGSIHDSGMQGDSGPPGDSSGACAFSGALATWSLTGQTGSQASTASATNAQGVTAGALTRGGALTPAAGTNSINSSGWSTGGLDKTKYYTLALTPPNGCGIGVMSLALDWSASGTGPTSAAIGTSADGFTATTPATTMGSSTVSISANAPSGMLEIRVYGLGASATTGTMRIQNTLSVTGALQ
jgi:hypothetical protein